MENVISRNYNFSVRALVAVLALGIVAGGAGSMLMKQAAAGYELWPLGNWFGSGSLAAATDKTIVKVVSEESQVIDSVKKASPAVVSIVATAEVPTYETVYSQPFSDLPPEMQQMFGFSVPEQRQNGTQKQKIGAGTGFLVSPDGYIVTNKHVVEDEKAEYTVILNNDKNKGEKLIAKVLARDPNNDLAVLKIAKKDLPYLEFGDSSQLQVGQTALTIGYALGEFDNTVSKGVVSGLSRSIVAGGMMGGGEQLKNLIQSDAAINPGNSGGPMLDIMGKVIGVNVAMANAQNIGFAIPGNYAKAVYDEVKKTGTIKQAEAAFLGIRYLPVNSALKANNKLPYDYGALVSRGEKQTDLAVVPGSPADLAGIVENDIILAVNGTKVDDNNPLAELVAKYKPGDEIKLKVYHKGKESLVTVKLTKK